MTDIPAITGRNHKQVQWLGTASIVLPKTLRGKTATQVLEALNKYYRLTDTHKPANKTTAAFRAVWQAVHAPEWKMPFSAVVADEYEAIVFAAIIFYHAAEPVTRRTDFPDYWLVQSAGYQAW